MAERVRCPNLPLISHSDRRVHSPRPIHRTRYAQSRQARRERFQTRHGDRG